MSLKSKREWILPSEKNEDILNHILKLRKVEDTTSYLEPRIDDIPSSKKLYDCKKASKKILEHIGKGGKIVIHGDYDADGICASALLWEFLYKKLSEFLGKEIDVLPYIPDRVEQGYGLTEDSLNDLFDLGASLVITVDCGVRDKELIQKYMSEKKMDFVVTDHHQPPEDILEDIKYPLVHQMYPGKEYPFTEISGTAVVYLLIQALMESVGMEKDAYYGLDLVAFTTVTDIMPLIDVNRIFVKLGLEEISKGERHGLRFLALRAGVELKEISAYHIGYILGPRINAVGRIGSPMDAVRLLVSNSEDMCKEIANKLENTNYERQQVTAGIYSEALESVKETDDNILIVKGNDWHEGIIGLVAGRLQEKYYKPVIVVTLKDGLMKGSARSIKGFNITKALEKHKKYLDRYGGHELAAGFSMQEKKWDKFESHITQHANEKIDEDILKPTLKVEILLESTDVTKELVNNLSKLEPFGFGNPKPYTSILGLEIKRKQVIGKEANHLKLFVKGTGADYLTLLLFNCGEDVETLQEGQNIDVVGYPDINVWNGTESMQFNVKEWRESSS